MRKEIKTFLLFALPVLVFTACSRNYAKPPTQPISPKPETPLPSVAPDPNTQQPSNGKFVDLKILTFNCWGVPKIVVYEPTKDQKERFTNIATVINGYDIVNLQETFSDNANIIMEAANYTTKERYNNTSFGSYGSGLASFSKYPLVKRGFRKFSECAGADCFSNKGVFFMRLKVPEIGEVDIYNTHYQAIESKEDLRLSANREFADFLKQNEVGNLTIITGDFNYTNYDATDKTSKAYIDFMKRFNPIDVFRVAYPQSSGFTNDHNINNYVGKDDKPQRLDYIFVLPENRGITAKKVNYKVEVKDTKIMFTQPVNGKFLSDHFGLTTTLRVNLL
ncbi:MAG: endonuclease/exonuclease/phosphatase family protein [Candidatus Sericytochromatia bacterium]